MIIILTQLGLAQQALQYSIPANCLLLLKLNFTGRTVPQKSTIAFSFRYNGLSQSIGIVDIQAVRVQTIQLLNLYSDKIEAVLKVTDAKGEDLAVDGSAIQFKTEYPGRANMATNNFFGFLIDYDQFSKLKIALPFNMPQKSGIQNNFIEPGFKPKSFDQQPNLFFWIGFNGTQTIQHWIPFFSNCQGFNSHIFLFSLTQNPKYCRLVPVQETVLFSGYFQDGFTVNADSCEMQTRCYPDEFSFKSLSKPAWYTLDMKKLFFIREDAFNNSELTLVNFGGGNSSLVQQVLAHHQNPIVPVIIVQQTPYLPGAQPTRVSFDIKYLQSSTTVKKIIHAQLIVHSYQTPEKQAVPFNLTIRYQPLSFAEAFDRAAFGHDVYALFIFLAALLIMAVLNLLRRGCLFVLKSRNRLTAFIRLMVQPILVGFLLFIGTFTLLTAVFLTIASETGYSAILFDYDNLNSFRTTANKLGRCGLTMYLCAFLSQLSGVNMAVPLPNQNYIKLIKRNIKKEIISKEYPSDQSLLGEFLSINKAALGLTHEQLIEQFDLCGALSYKRRYIGVVFLFLSFLLCFYLQNLSNFKYSTFLSKYLIIVPTAELVFVVLIRKYILNDYAYVLPMLVALHTLSSSLCFVGSTLFEIFIIYTCIMLLSMFLPVFAFLLYECLSLKCGWILLALHRLTGLSLFSHLETLLYKEPECDTFKLYLNRSPNSLLRKERSLLYLIHLESVVASSIAKPFWFVALLASQNITKICEYLSVNLNILINTCIFVIASAVIEIFLAIAFAEVLDSALGLGLYNLLEQYRHEYDKRELPWLFDSFPLNSFLDLPFRTVDKLCLCSQFHYLSYTLSLSTLFMLLGMQSFFMQNYNPFNDPLLILLIIILYTTFALFQFLAGMVYRKLHIYEPEDKYLGKDPLQVVHLRFDTQKLKHLMRDCQVKKHFLSRNREWLINNLFKIIPIDAFYSNSDQLQRIYNRLDQNEKQAFRLRKYKAYEATKNVKKRSASATPPTKMIELSRPLYQKMKRFMFYWLSTAKQYVFLKGLVLSEKKLKKQPFCKECKIDFMLQLFEKVPFKELVNLFRLKILGLPFRKAEWVEFYLKNQIFQTLCFQCVTKRLEDRQFHRREKALTPKERILKVSAKKAALYWLMKARSKLYHKIKVK